MSMFREHWIGALVAYSIFFCVSFIATFVVPLVHDGLSVEWNPTVAAREPLKMAGCFAIAVLFGLWPDVDIKSKSQKIFYRVLFVLNVLLIVLWGKYLESALLGLFAMLPIISKHRGWTHSKLTMLLLPGVFLLIPMYGGFSEWGSGGNLVARLDVLGESVDFAGGVRSGMPFYVASFIGYATHLHLDGILFRSRRSQRRKAQSRQ